ncbi:MAG: hypothetical protein ACOYW9_16270 [Deinococcota bacterium]
MSLGIPQGSSGQTTLTVTPKNGFTGTVSLSLVAWQDPVPAGLTLDSASVTVTQTSPTSNPLYGVAYGGSTFVAVGNNGTILTSP